MTNEHLDPKILGQLLLMQSVISNIPDTKSVFSFICQGLIDVPGVFKIEYQENNSFIESGSKEYISYPIELKGSYFGELVFTLDDKNSFNIYEHYITNFVFIVAVMLEERNHRKEIEEHKILLEDKIKERTKELEIEKQNLVESQRRYKDMMSNVNLFSVMLNRKGEIIFVNDFLVNITGYSIEELEGRNWFDIFIPKNEIESDKKVFHAFIKGDEFPKNYENKILTKDRKELVISWNNTVLRNPDNSIAGTASIGEDITLRKKNEQLLKDKNDEIEAQNEEYLQINEELKEKNEELIIARQKAEESDRLKTAFLQNVSHEIRTPMNGIMGFSSILVQNFNDKEKLKRFTDIIYQRSKDLLAIIDDVLNISKIESNQLPITIENFTLKSLFDEVESLFQGFQKKIGKEHITLIINIPNEYLLCQISTDNIKLKQILINLISNALKFTNEGSITISCVMQDSDLLKFTVSDTGIGIPFDKQEKVFERFYQVEENDFDRSGTGLGLPIVKGLVGLLGGTISLQSYPGQGSVFSFTIKNELKKRTESRESGEDSEPFEERHDFKNKTILIVEDDIFNAEYLKEIIEPTSCNILQTKYGEEAVKIVAEQEVDAILMDVRLPGINGYDATRQIKKMKPNIFIIAQTAYALVDEKQKAINAGCDDYISKPTNKEHLLAILKKHFQ